MADPVAAPGHAFSRLAARAGLLLGRMPHPTEQARCARSMAGPCTCAQRRSTRKSRLHKPYLQPYHACEAHRAREAGPCMCAPRRQKSPVLTLFITLPSRWERARAEAGPAGAHPSAAYEVARDHRAGQRYKHAPDRAAVVVSPNVLPKAATLHCQDSQARQQEGRRPVPCKQEMPGGT